MAARAPCAIKGAPLSVSCCAHYAHDACCAVYHASCSRSGTLRASFSLSLSEDIGRLFSAYTLYLHSVSGIPTVATLSPNLYSPACLPAPPQFYHSRSHALRAPCLSPVHVHGITFGENLASIQPCTHAHTHRTAAAMGDRRGIYLNISLFSYTLQIISTFILNDVYLHAARCARYYLRTHTGNRDALLPSNAYMLPFKRILISRCATTAWFVARDAATTYGMPPRIHNAAPWLRAPLAYAGCRTFVKRAAARADATLL